jgi:hypothetical protein
MPNVPVDQALLESVLTRIREGFVEGIRREVERCRRLGLPLYVARNGTVDVIAPDGASQTDLAG